MGCIWGLKEICTVSKLQNFPRGVASKLSSPGLNPGAYSSSSHLVKTLISSDKIPNLSCVPRGRGGSRWNDFICESRSGRGNDAYETYSPPLYPFAPLFTGFILFFSFQRQFSVIKNEGSIYFDLITKRKLKNMNQLNSPREVSLLICLIRMTSSAVNSPHRLSSSSLSLAFSSSSSIKNKSSSP